MSNTITPEVRRAAFRRYARVMWVGFLFGVSFVCLFMKAYSIYRFELNGLVGEFGKGCIFLVGGISCLFLPTFVAAHFAVKSPLLYCPHCGSFLLAGMRSMNRLNQHQECACCGNAVPIAKPSPWQVIFDIALGFGGLLLEFLLLCYFL